MVRMLESLETFPNVGKPANVIIVDSPEVAREIRELYPADHPIFVKPDSNLFGFGQQSIVMTGSVPAGMTTFSQGFSKTNLPGPPGMWWYRYGKPGPVVVVETPEAEAAVRELYPSGSTIFVRPEELPELGQVTPPARRHTWPLSLLTAGVGVIFAFIGFTKRNKPLGSMLMAAGGSMVGTSTVLVLRDLIVD